MSDRILLPVWKVYKNSIDLSKEEPETFGWMTGRDSRDYEAARAALDSIPGSREFLKTYEYNEAVDVLPFGMGMANKIVSSMGAWHSGSSSTALAWDYQALLNDWDAFVVEKKTAMARAAYDAKQIGYAQMSFYLKPGDPTIPVIQQMNDEELAKYENCETLTMLRDLHLEIRDESVARLLTQEKQRFDDNIEVLEHHYKYPQRWADTIEGSYLLGSPLSITEDMIEVMEIDHPDYREHVKYLIDEHVERRKARGITYEYAATSTLRRRT